MKSPTLPLLLALAFAASLVAEVRLPKIFSNDMVIQRDQPIAVWGWAEPDEMVRIALGEDSASATADENGRWETSFSPRPASNSPIVLSAKGDTNSIRLENILLGDVWVASGQSNMEWVLRNTDNADAEIANSNHPQIRMFTAEKAMSFSPQDDFTGGEWEVSNPENTDTFSAVAYFFARKLQSELNIPIGIIHTSWGGTDVRTWMSWDTASQYSEYSSYDPLAMLKTATTNSGNLARYEHDFANDKGLEEAWYEPDTDTSDWKPATVATRWETTDIGESDGIAWFRIDFNLPAELAGKAATLSLGPIDDNDVTYLNGDQVGATNQWDTARIYPIPANATHSGSNTVVVKVVDNGGGGGIYGASELLYLKIGNQRIPLTNGWIYKGSALSADYGIVIHNPNTYPSQLYNAMIHPIIDYQAKGFIWYQGENNTGEAHRYRNLFKDMILDWRSKWGAELPFYWVQLANFLAPAEQPGDSAWAELREAQDMALSLPKTGQAIAIDIGQADDIHPRNKQDVGLRLALAALHTTYGQKIVYSGPRYKSMNRKGNKIVISFENVANGLIAKHDRHGYLKDFAIAGKDQKFHWAQAYIDGKKIVVFSSKVKKPVAVRYAWANNPHEANLYNSENLPAAPFRTDDWPGITVQQ